MVRIMPIGVPTCLSRRFPAILFYFLLVGKNNLTMVNSPWYVDANISTTPRPSAVGTLRYLINSRSTCLWLVRTLAAVRIVSD